MTTKSSRERARATMERWRSWLAYFASLGLSSKASQLAEAERLGRLDEFKQLAAEVNALTAGQSQ